MQRKKFSARKERMMVIFLDGLVIFGKFCIVDWGLGFFVYLLPIGLALLREKSESMV